jgi:hypothetical protein
MNDGKFANGIRKETRRIAAAGLATLLIGTMALAPVSSTAATTKSRGENRVVSYREVDRAEIENLQRWVAAGHEEWCKDARLVAAEELKRIVTDFDGGVTDLNTLNLVEGADSSGGAKTVAFEWTPLDGRATYRVTVERFEWLLPIAGNADAIVWVPTLTEIQIHE